MSNKAKETPRFEARNITPLRGNEGLFSCQISDVDAPTGHPCVDIAAIDKETLKMWDRIQHEAHLWRMHVRVYGEEKFK